MLPRTAHRTAGRTVKGRTMRRTPPTRAHRIATALVLVAAVIATGAAAAPAQLSPAKSVRAPGCTLKRAKTIKANRDVRVFRTVPVTGSGTVYGCRRRAARAYVLGEFGECQNNHEIRRVEVAGRRTARLALIVFARLSVQPGARTLFAGAPTAPVALTAAASTSVVATRCARVGGARRIVSP
jgi:hypothetical protein